MSQDILNYDQQLSRLLIKWIDTFDTFTDDEKILLFEMAYKNRHNNNSLYGLFVSIKQGKEKYIDKDCTVEYNLVNDQCQLIQEGKSVLLRKERALHLLSGFLELLDEILPIGSVVTLKNIKDDTTDEIPLIIITHRFVLQKDMSSYFTYAGVPYPVGEMKDNKVLHFTTQSIENNIFRGYSNDIDLAYVLMMKEQIILERKVHSISFNKLYRKSEDVNQ